MSCAVVWSSKTGNTELLARSIVGFVGNDCVYAGGTFVGCPWGRPSVCGLLDG
ncbi:MAG: hypothetical protein ACLTSX_01660 [Collinsella sp.]